jgi:chromosome segregation ATPase
MSFITRGILRWGLIGGLGITAVAVLFPDAALVGLHHVRTTAQGVIDSAMDDPVALRRQLERLAEQYPDRIAEVQNELVQVNQQIEEFAHDVEISQRVVAMTTDDLTNLKTLVARAESQAQMASTARRDVVIHFQGVSFDIDEAYTEGHRINTVRGTYQDRLATDEFQLDLLREQKGRLNDILVQLEDEYNTYQAQLWQLDREIDAIQRNDKLIVLMKQQQDTLAGYEKYGKVENLKQLQGKLAELRLKQQAQLEALAKMDFRRDYEERAQLELEGGEPVDASPFGDLIEAEDEDEPTTDNSVAWADPVIIR